MVRIVNEFSKSVESSIKRNGTVKSLEGENFAVKIAEIFDSFDQEMGERTFLENLDSRVEIGMRNSTDIQRYPSMKVS